MFCIFECFSFSSVTETICNSLKNEIVKKTKVIQFNNKAENKNRLTKEELITFPGFENSSESELNESIKVIHALSDILYELIAGNVVIKTKDNKKQFPNQQNLAA
ncbi:MAG: hypothetical protein BGO09_00290 [Bacteroidetes bacterium 47-18]|nr:MAG: hypothetical protein BGO09_00290 [Bacteroidetes bacterium 47-18]